MFVFGPSLLMIGEWTWVLNTTVTATVGVVLLAAGLHGYLLTRASLWQRALLVVAAFVLIKPGLMTDLIGIGLGLLVLAFQFVARRREAAEASAGKTAEEAVAGE